MSTFFDLAEVNTARAGLGMKPVQRTFKTIGVYAKLPGGGTYYLASTTFARSLKEAREMYATTQPRAGYAASDLFASYAHDNSEVQK